MANRFKMLKNLPIYMVFSLLGLLLGYLVFSSSNNLSKEVGQAAPLRHGKWTCSMHPEIDGKEDGSCPLCAMDLVYMENSSTSELLSNQFEMSDDAIALANIQTVEVEMLDKNDISINLSGVITTNKETDAVQTTLFDGRLEELYFNSVGKKVRMGQKLGLIYSPELYLAQDKLLTSASYKQSHQKLYDAARNSLGLWKMTDEQIDMMLKSGKPMVNFPLYSDVNGTITEIIASEGDFYKQGDPLFRTSDLRTVWAVLDAYEGQLQKLQVGQSLEINFAGLPAEKIVTEISFIEPIFNQQKRTVKVRALLSNKSGKLKPGMFVNAKVRDFSIDENVLAVPKSSVLWTGKRSLVYKKIDGAKPTFEMTEIQLGQQFDEFYEVLSGLEIGDFVVAEGVFTIDAAAQLNGKKSMMSKSSEMDHLNMNRLKDRSEKIKIGVGLESSINDLLEQYMVIKNALVSDDAKLVKEEAYKFVKLYDTTIDSTDSAKGLVRLEKIRAKAKSMGVTDELRMQRLVFEKFSNEFLYLVSVLPNLGSELYVQHCDCVNNRKGASWLSMEEQVKNPYFGAQMLNCGRVERTIR